MKDLQLGTTYTPDTAMSLAIDLAYQGANRVSPNPMVGCVVLDKSYQLLSYGYHKKYGGPHAERDALDGLEVSRLEGAHVFVTLEPCAHHGKTPPCADFIANLPIESLTYGLEDPNPEVSGKGIQTIRNAGIQVFQNDKRKQDLEDLLDTFLYHLNHERPFVALKIATSLDSMIRDANNKSQWITSETSREHAHQIRSRFQAVLVGKNTVLQDNPSLNVRHPDFSSIENRVIVLNASGDLIPEIEAFNICKVRKAEDVFLVVDKKADLIQQCEPIVDDLYIHKEKRVHIFFLDTDADDFFENLSQQVYAQGIYDIMVEGGSGVMSLFLKNKFFDRLYTYQAAKLLGAKGGLNWTAEIQSSLDKPIDLDLVCSQQIGSEIFTKWNLRR